MSRFRYADRLAALPPYLFAEIDRKKAALLERGVDVIDLGVGDPDLPTPRFIVEAMQKETENPGNHRYPSYAGLPEFREAVARWYRRRFGVALDPSSEVVALIGSKEGLAHLPLAFVNPGDPVLITDPGYPVYGIATVFAEGRPVYLRARAEAGFLPDYDDIPDADARGARLLFINYPNNPTSAVADRSFFDRTAAYARERDLIVCHDAAYTEIYYDEGDRPASFLEAEGAREVGIEFHSLSKTFNMTGWRIGFAVGNAEAIAGLGKIKTNVDSGLFEAIQRTGISALDSDDAPLRAIRETYRERRDVLCRGLRKAGLEFAEPRATFYVWVRVPKGQTSAGYCAHLLERAGIVSTPGNGFGRGGEGYIRLTLCLEKERLAEAAERLQRI